MNLIVRPYLALVCTLLLAVPPSLFAADPPQAPGSQKPMKENSGIRDWITSPYRAPVVPDNNLANSTRIESLMRAGNLYLSLQDTIALALENNLDIAIQRYGPMVADTTVQ